MISKQPLQLCNVGIFLFINTIYVSMAVTITSLSYEQCSTAKQVLHSRANCVPVVFSNMLRTLVPSRSLVLPETGKEYVPFCSRRSCHCLSMVKVVGQPNYSV